MHIKMQRVLEFPVARLACKGTVNLLHMLLEIANGGQAKPRGSKFLGADLTNVDLLIPLFALMHDDFGTDVLHEWPQAVETLVANPASYLLTWMIGPDVGIELSVSFGLAAFWHSCSTERALQHASAVGPLL